MSQQPQTTKRQRIRTVQRDIIAPIASAAFLIGAGVLVFFTFRSFGWTVFLAVLLYVAFEGVYKRLHTLVVSSDLAAISTLVLILVIVLGPLAIVVTMIVNQGIQTISNIRSWIESDQVFTMISWFPELIDLLTDRSFFWVYWLDRYYVILSEYSDVINSFRVGSLVGGAYSYVLGGLGMSFSFLFNLTFAFVLLYFLFKEGDSFYKMIRRAMPFSVDVVDQFKDRLKEIIQAILRGNVLIAILQGTMIGIGLWLCGIPNALLYGSIAAFLSIIPIIGTGLVWLPAALYIYFFRDQTLLAIGLGIYGLGCYLILENIVKPKLLDRHLGVHSLLLFFAILGGLKEFGISGFILGPFILAFFLTIWRFYHIWGSGDDAEQQPALPTTELPNDTKPKS